MATVAELARRVAALEQCHRGRSVAPFVRIDAHTTADELAAIRAALEAWEGEHPDGPPAFVIDCLPDPDLFDADD